MSNVRYYINLQEANQIQLKLESIETVRKIEEKGQKDRYVKVRQNNGVLRKSFMWVPGISAGSFFRGVEG